jgi:hypothetical protein
MARKEERKECSRCPANIWGNFQSFAGIVYRIQNLEIQEKALWGKSERVKMLLASAHNRILRKAEKQRSQVSRKKA